MPAIYGSLPAFAELYILKSYRRKNFNDFFRTDRGALKRNFLHLNGKLCAALLRGLFCLNEKAEEAVTPPAEVYLNYHLCRMRIFPLPRIKRILFRPVFLFSPRRRRDYPNRVFSPPRYAALFALPARLSLFFAEILPRFFLASHALSLLPLSFPATRLMRNKPQLNPR